MKNELHPADQFNSVFTLRYEHKLISDIVAFSRNMAKQEVA